ncbi:MAG: hypothetical protein LBT35_01875, partial [Tannerella sp.]|nr:hypothetical protein [Tannerella sp.]
MKEEIACAPSHKCEEMSIKGRSNSPIISLLWEHSLLFSAAKTRVLHSLVAVARHLPRCGFSCVRSRTAATNTLANRPTLSGDIAKVFATLPTICGILENAFVTLLTNCGRFENAFVTLLQNCGRLA